MSPDRKPPRAWQEDMLRGDYRYRLLRIKRMSQFLIQESKRVIQIRKLARLRDFDLDQHPELLNPEQEGK